MTFRMIQPSPYFYIGTFLKKRLSGNFGEINFLSANFTLARDDCCILTLTGGAKKITISPNEHDTKMFYQFIDVTLMSLNYLITSWLIYTIR